jgi:zinc transporter ZupT
MVDYRYIAIATIFISSLCGTLLSYMSLTTHSKLMNYISPLKMLSSGIILSLSFIHIIPEASLELYNFVDYPISNVCVLVGLIFCIFTENALYFKTVEKGHDDEEHQHACLTNLNSENENLVCPGLSLYIFEFACVFHNLIIGIGLGSLTDTNMIVVLVIALAIHQFLEAMSLSVIILEAKQYNTISVVNITLMIAAFSLTTPLGIVIGILSEKHSLTEPAVWVIIRNCLLSISAGILIYISIITLMMEELSKTKVHNKGFLYKMSLYGSFMIGAVLMGCLGIWA